MSNVNQQDNCQRLLAESMHVISDHVFQQEQKKRWNINKMKFTDNKIKFTEDYFGIPKWPSFLKDMEMNKTLTYLRLFYCRTQSAKIHFA